MQRLVSLDAVPANTTVSSDKLADTSLVESSPDGPVDSWATAPYAFGLLCRLVASHPNWLSLPTAQPVSENRPGAESGQDDGVDLDLGSVLGRAVRRWCTSPWVMTGLATLDSGWYAFLIKFLLLFAYVRLRSRGKLSQLHLHRQQADSSTEVRATLTTALMSHSHGVRSGALALLGSPLLFRPTSRGKSIDTPDSADDSADVTSALARCRAAEAIPLTVQGARERALLTSRVALGAGTTAAAQLCLSWLLGEHSFTVM